LFTPKSPSAPLDNRCTFFSQKVTFRIQSYWIIRHHGNQRGSAQYGKPYSWRTIDNEKENSKGSVELDQGSGDSSHLRTDNQQHVTTYL